MNGSQPIQIPNTATKECYINNDIDIDIETDNLNVQNDDDNNDSLQVQTTEIAHANKSNNIDLNNDNNTEIARKNINILNNMGSITTDRLISSSSLSSNSIINASMNNYSINSLSNHSHNQNNNNSNQFNQSQISNNFSINNNSLIKSNINYHNIISNQISNSFTDQNKVLNDSFIESSSFNDYLHANNLINNSVISSNINNSYYINNNNNTNNSNSYQTNNVYVNNSLNTNNLFNSYNAYKNNNSNDNIHINNNFHTGSLPIENQLRGQYLESIHENDSNANDKVTNNSNTNENVYTNNILNQRNKVNHDFELTNEKVLDNVHNSLKNTEFSTEISNQEIKANHPPNENLIDIVDFPIDKLLKMLSLLLNKIIDSNDELVDGNYPPLIPDETNIFSCFYGKHPPQITIEQYLLRIQKYCPTTNDIYLSLLVYFDKISKKCNNYMTNNNNSIINNSSTHTDQTNNASTQSQAFVMDSYNIHRLLIAGVTVSTKFFSDFFYSNSRYSRVGGISLNEMNNLELKFMMLVDFKLIVEIDELQRYADLLYKFWENNQTEIVS